MYGFIWFENGGLEQLPNNVGFVPNHVLMQTNLSFIISGTLTCIQMLVYVYACMKHAHTGLEHACAYACMRTHSLGSSWSFVFKNSFIWFIKEFYFPKILSSSQFQSDWALNQPWTLEFLHHWRMGARVVRGTKCSVYNAQSPSLRIQLPPRTPMLSCMPTPPPPHYLSLQDL